MNFGSLSAMPTRIHPRDSVRYSYAMVRFHRSVWSRALKLPAETLRVLKAPYTSGESGEQGESTGESTGDIE